MCDKCIMFTVSFLAGLSLGFFSVNLVLSTGVEASVHTFEMHGFSASKNRCLGNVFRALFWGCSGLL